MSSNGNSLQFGSTARGIQSSSNMARFSSTSSSVSNPSGGRCRSYIFTLLLCNCEWLFACLAPTTMPEFNRECSSSFLDSMPMFSGSTTAEFLSEFFLDTSNSIGAHANNQKFGNIFYILGKKFRAKLVPSPLECPAYDMNKQLVGFIGEKSEFNFTFPHFNFLFSFL